MSKNILLFRKIIQTWCAFELSSLKLENKALFLAKNALSECVFIFELYLFGKFYQLLSSLHEINEL